MDTGEYEDDFFGIKVACECKLKLRNQENIEKERLQKVLSESKGSLVTGGEMAASNSVIPIDRMEDNFNFDMVNDYILEQYTKKGYNLGNYINYESCVATILTSIRTGVKLEKSYLLGAPKGFGKTTLINTCLKYLIQQDKKVVPYVSLSELGVLYSNHLRKINSSKYLHMSAVYREGNTEQDLDEDTEDVVSLISNFKWYDFLECEALFIGMTSPQSCTLECDILRVILEYRGKLMKPTVCTINESIGSYTANNYAGQLFFTNYIDQTSLARRSYSRLKHISCYCWKGKKSE